MADAEGLAAVSMRRLADALGVAPMSLYTYIPSKAELLDLMLDRVYGTMPPAERPGNQPTDSVGSHDGQTAGSKTTVSTDVVAPRPEAVTSPSPPTAAGNWRERLAEVARTNWALHRAHPWIAAVAATRPSLGPGATAKYERELAAFDGLGLDDLAVDDALTLLLTFVRAAAALAADARTAEAQSAMSDAEWWQAAAPHLAKALDPERFPRAVRVGTAAGQARGTAYDPDHAFEYGLARILDGLAGQIPPARAGEV
jgi:AcrR family transcriptional regulator